MRRAVLALLFLIVPLGIVSVLPPSARADSISELKDQIEAINRERAKIDEEIAAYQRQLNVLSGERQTLQGAIQTLDVSRNKTAAQIREIQGKISGATLRLSQLALEINDKESSIALDEAAVAASLRAMDQAGQTTILEQILGAEGFSDAWVRVDNMGALNQALQTHARLLRDAKMVLAEQQESVVATKNELSSANVDLGNQKKALDINRQSQQQLLSQTQSKEAEYQALIAAKRAEQAQFESALFDLASKLQYAVDPSSIPSAGQGVLRWPVDDPYITQQFGRTSDAGRLYASGTHDGIDLRASVGTPIKAALAGTVFEVNQGAAPNCQYGKWVIVKHANGLATLYAHLSSINVSRGQSVSSGDVLGNSGMTGYATGPHLHFTVYLAEALSLKQYTCKSGTTVTIPIAPPNAYLNPLSYL